MATSQRLLAIAIFGLLVAGIATAIVKGPEQVEGPLGIAPSDSASPTPTETFTFPGPVPTESETQLFPTESETPAGPEASPSELPRTGGGSFVGASLLTLMLAAGGALLVARTARGTR